MGSSRRMVGASGTGSGGDALDSLASSTASPRAAPHRGSSKFETGGGGWAHTVRVPSCVCLKPVRNVSLPPTPSLASTCRRGSALAMCVTTSHSTNGGALHGNGVSPLLLYVFVLHRSPRWTRVHPLLWRRVGCGSGQYAPTGPAPYWQQVRDDGGWGWARGQPPLADLQQVRHGGRSCGHSKGRCGRVIDGCCVRGLDGAV